MTLYGSRDGIGKVLMTVFSGLLSCLSGATWGQVTVPGQFAVSPFGAATYTIPIRVPTGVAGIEPKLSLVYSSQSGKGNLGQGWSLQGLSVITRCPQTIAQDGQSWGVHHDANDRLCMDGQRLVLIAGTYGVAGAAYRTEIESFSRITQPTSDSFVVETRAGLKMTYGLDGAAIPAHPVPSPIVTWALSKVEDRQGNAMTFSYVVDPANGTYVPNTINFAYDQAGVCRARVSFTHSDKTGDEVPYYRAGSVTRARSFLTAIETSVSDNCGTWSRVRRYALSYDANGTGQSSATGRYLLGSIQECGRTDAACLRPTSFTYQQSFENFVLSPPAYYDNGANEGFYRGFKYVAGDFNGDGKTDFVHFHCTDIPYTVYPDNYNTTYQGCTSATVWTSVGGGQFSIGAANPMDVVLAPNDDFTTTNTSNFDMVRVGDFNGDGKADLAQMRISVAGMPNYRTIASLTVWRSNGDGTFTPFGVDLSGLDLSVPATFRASMLFTAGDADGDGLSDLIWYHQPGGVTRKVEVLHSNGNWTFGKTGPQAILDQATGPNGSALIIYADYDGDGKIDILSLRNQNTSSVTVSFGQTGGYFSAPISFTPWIGYGLNANNYNFQAGDFNGDGRADLIHFVDNSWVNVWLSKANGEFDVRQFSPGGGYAVSVNGYYFLSGDFNGDGKTDLLHVVDNNNTALWRGRGDGTFDITSGFPQSNYPGYPVQPLPSAFLQGDFNGDGKTDLAHFVSPSYLHVWNAAPFGPTDVVTQIFTGIDLRHPQYRIGYMPMTSNAAEGGVYWPDTTSLPASAAALRSSMPLVLGYFEDTGRYTGPYPGERYIGYQYAGTAFDRQGRGFLGFRGVYRHDYSTDTETRSFYLQTHPFIGMTQYTGVYSTYGGGWRILSESGNTPSAIALGGTRYFPYVQTNDEVRNDPNAMPISKVRTYFVYGESPTYGNITRAETYWLTDGWGLSGHSQIVDNQYWNDSTNWIIGRVTRSQVTHTKP